jgi:hypothetical protein
MKLHFLASSDVVEACGELPNVYVVRESAFRDDGVLLAALCEIVGPSYEDPTALLVRELQHCDTLYLGTDDEGRLACFYFVAWESLDVDGLARPAVYLGLSATRDDLKGRGGALSVYACWLMELAAREQASETSFVLWGTTATPLVYMNAHAALTDLNPLPDGGYSDDAVRTARAIRAQLNIPEEDGYPFLLKGVAVGTRYSKVEAARIASVSSRRQFTLFDRLGVVEARGDRLLFVALSPWSIGSSTLSHWSAAPAPQVEVHR